MTCIARKLAHTQRSVHSTFRCEASVLNRQFFLSPKISCGEHGTSIIPPKNLFVFLSPPPRTRLLFYVFAIFPRNNSFYSTKNSTRPSTSCEGLKGGRPSHAHDSLLSAPCPMSHKRYSRGQEHHTNPAQYGAIDCFEGTKELQRRHLLTCQKGKCLVRLGIICSQQLDTQKSDNTSIVYAPGSRRQIKRGKGLEAGAYFAIESIDGSFFRFGRHVNQPLVRKSTLSTAGASRSTLSLCAAEEAGAI